MEEKINFSELDDLLKTVKLDNVTADGAGFEDLPDGYYLCQVDSAKLTTSKSSGKPMASFQLTVVEDGYQANFDDAGNASLSQNKHTANKKIFKHYVLKDEKSIRNFVADMLKFEGENPGEPLLEKEVFMESALLEEALGALEGMRIYAQLSTSEKEDGTKSSWTNFISWKRVAALELPQ